MNNLYHLVGRTPDRKVFKTPLAQLWKESLYSLTPLRVHAFVLMPNHFHLLAETTRPALNLKCFSSLEMISEKIPNNHVYRETYRYILLNPVRGGLCKFPHHYPYSTFNNPNLPFLLHSRISLGLGGAEGELRWIMGLKQPSLNLSQQS